MTMGAQASPEHLLSVQIEDVIRAHDAPMKNAVHWGHLERRRVMQATLRSKQSCRPALHMKPREHS